jgi:uncharacterized protein (TIRG00374 family)
VARPGFWVGLLVSLVACALLYRWTNWQQFWQTLSRADLRWILVVLAVMQLDRIFMAAKWTLLARGGGLAISLPMAVKANYVAEFWASVLPASVGGDVVRLGWLMKRAHSGAAVLSSMVVERLLGMLALALWAVASVGLIGIHAVGLGEAYWSLPLLFVVTIAAIAAVFSRGVHRVVQSLVDRLPAAGLRERAARARAALLAFRERPRLLAVFLLLSILEQGFPLASVYCLARALAIPVSIGPLVIGVPMVLVLSRLPISIAGIGITEGAFVFVLSFAGVATSQSLVLAVVDRVLLVVSSLPGMLWTVAPSTSETPVPVPFRSGPP